MVVVVIGGAVVVVVDVGAVVVAGPVEIEDAVPEGRISLNPDGSVTFSKAHRGDCPFVATVGAQVCDDGCLFPHPVDANQQAVQCQRGRITMMVIRPRLVGAGRSAG